MSLVIGGVASPKANRTTLPSPSGFWQNLVHFLVFRIALMFGRRGTVKRELRTQSGGRPLRTLYAFNPLRTAILLIGGDKTGDDIWYERFVPLGPTVCTTFTWLSYERRANCNADPKI